MPKRILWMSRHLPHSKQLAALKEQYGNDVIVEQETQPFDDAHQIATRFFNDHYDDMVIVAPLSVIQILCGLKVPMLWAECVEENDLQKIDFRGARGQGFRFVRFRRIKQVTLEFED